MHWLLSGKIPFSPMLKRLHALAGQEAARTGGTITAAFDPVGLILTEELDDFDSSATPMNVSPFADTGGDGVHYSLLHINGQVTDQSPVVMTVPIMGEEGNLIVGETLHDFLCLGCQTGYFWLEQLVYDRAETISNLLHPEQVFISSYGEAYTEDLYYRELKNQLLLLTREFGLSPWPEVEARLQKLQQDYVPRLEFSRRDQW